MSRTRILLIVSSVLGAAVILFVILAWPAIQRSFFYPKPRGLPPVVGQSMEELLARLEAVLETNAVVVAHSLQSGLSITQISALEARGGFRLSEDLRALYRWRNGMPTNSTVGLLAGERFLPLDAVARERATIQHTA